LAYHNQGKFHRALDDFNRTISINRSDEDAWFHRGLAHLELDEREPACTAFRQADQFGHDEAAGMLQRHCPNHNAEPDPQPR
jgi:Flp pilus assembly protein TadD